MFSWIFTRKMYENKGFLGAKFKVKQGSFSTSFL